MPILNGTEFAKVIKQAKQSCLMGLDVGTKKVGVAVSDAAYQIAAPLTTLDRHYEEEELFVKRFIPLYKENEACGLVVGWPLSVNNQISKQCQDILTCVHHIWSISKMDIPVLLMDERYSTNYAESILTENNMKRRKVRKYKDQLSAVIILQSYLDQYNNIDVIGDIFNYNKYS